MKILLIFCYLFASCQVTNKEVPYDTIELNHINTSDIDLEKAFKEVRLVSIDDNGVFVPNTDKLLYRDDKIYISDGVRIYIYDRDAKMIGSIDRQGKANNEYIKITDFDVINNQVVVLDNVNRRVLAYDFIGKMLYSIKLDIFTSKISVLNDSTLILNNGYSNFDSTVDGKLTQVNVNSRETTSLGTINKHKLNYMHIMGSSHFYRTRDGEMLFYEGYSPHVYRVGDGVMDIALDVRFSNSPDNDFFNVDYADVLDFITRFQEGKYVSGISNLYKEGGEIIFEYIDVNIRYYCWYDVKKQEVKYAGKFMLYGQIQVDDICFDKGRAIASLSADKIIEAGAKSDKVAGLIKRFNITNGSCPLLIVIDNI